MSASIDVEGRRYCTVRKGIDCWNGIGNGHLSFISNEIITSAQSCSIIPRQRCMTG